MSFAPRRVVVCLIVGMSMAASGLAFIGEASAAQCIECVPTSTTSSPNATFLRVGQPVHDDANVTVTSNGFPAEGNVTFFICRNSTCESIGTSALSGGDASSPDFTPISPGPYCFEAFFEGGGIYNRSNDSSVGECFTALPLIPTNTTSTPSATQIPAGGAISDNATVDSGVQRLNIAPTGNITFYLCGPGATSCDTGGVEVASSAIDANGSATSGDIIVTQPGTWCFRAAYEGDADFAPSSDGSSGECFTVIDDRLASITTTQPTSSSIDQGQSVQDEASVEAAPFIGDLRPLQAIAPTGNVTFYLCGAGVVPCASGGDEIGTVALVDGNATSPAVTPDAPGTYCFRGVYSGDNDFAPSSDAGRNECFVVRANVPFFPSLGAAALAAIGSIGVLGAVIALRRR